MPKRPHKGSWVEEEIFRMKLKNIMLGVVALLVFAGSVIPAHAYPHHRRHHRHHRRP